jgi:hypothetical protein
MSQHIKLNNSIERCQKGSPFNKKTSKHSWYLQETTLVVENSTVVTSKRDMKVQPPRAKISPKENLPA